MFRSRFPGALLFLAAIASPVTAQFGGGPKVILKRALPPAVPLEARTFNLAATSQVPEATPLADSFQALFKAKIQSDDRFIYADSKPELQMSIIVTRYYIEPKNLVDGRRSCTTYQGSLQGTFSVIEVGTGRPVASDTLVWKLASTDNNLVLVNDENVGMPLKGAGHQFTDAEMQENIQNSGTLDNIKNSIGIRNPFSGNRPCDHALTQNEARDVLADVFLTEIIHLSVPHTISQEVKVPNTKIFRDAVEEMADKQQWAKAGELLEALPVQAKPADEGARLYLIALANEGVGYKKGEESVLLNQQLKRGMTEAQTLPIRTNLKRVEDEAKALFDKAAMGYKDAKAKQDQDEYRAGERRAEESRRLYNRIQKYRATQSSAPQAALSAPAPPPPAPAAPAQNTQAAVAPPAPVAAPPAPNASAGLAMSDIVGMCRNGSSSMIIVDRIESAATLVASRPEADQLIACGDKQDAIFLALKKRWDVRPAPRPAAGGRGATGAARTPAPKPVAK